MIVPDALAQQIVETARCLIHCNVNLMNREGVIIGTSQPGRLRTFHKGASDVIASGAAVEIYPGEEALYPGALPGVNLPIVLDGQALGVVGVTGVPDEVRHCARLIKMITELILERELSRQETHNRHRQAEHLVELLLWDGAPRDKARIRRMAKALGFDLDLPRLVAVADLAQAMPEEQTSLGFSELLQDRSGETILSHLAALGVVGGEDLAVIMDLRLIVLKAMPLDSTLDEVNRLGDALEQALRRWAAGRRTPCGLGAVAERPEDYVQSYRQALFCLREETNGRRTGCVYDHDLSVAYLMREAAQGAAGMALGPLRRRLRAALEHKPRLRQTLTALLANNFESEATAHALNIHRNTLAYRLGRLKQSVGLDPVRSHVDAILLRALLCTGDCARDKAAQAAPIDTAAAAF